jgi:hypothetical protein
MAARGPRRKERRGPSASFQSLRRHLLNGAGRMVREPLGEGEGQLGSSRKRTRFSRATSSQTPVRRKSAHVSMTSGRARGAWATLLLRALLRVRREGRLDNRVSPVGDDRLGGSSRRMRERGARLHARRTESSSCRPREAGRRRSVRTRCALSDDAAAGRRVTRAGATSIPPRSERRARVT